MDGRIISGGEGEIMRRHQLKVCKNKNVRLWRNNVGVFYTKDGRMIRTGLCVGSADLIGFESIVITKEMVGFKVAIFRADEVKFRSSVSEVQKQWLSMCKGMGAIVNVIREDDL